MAKSQYLLLLCVLALGCSDDPEPDVRVQATGEYSFTGKYYYIAGGELISVGSDFNNRGSLSIVSDPNDANSILITDLADGKDIFRGVNISTAAEGFSFEVPSQKLGESTPAFMIQGYKGAALQSGQLAPRYHGVYLSATNELIFYWQFDQANTGFHFVSGYECVKK